MLQILKPDKAFANMRIICYFDSETAAYCPAASYLWSNIGRKTFPNV